MKFDRLLKTGERYAVLDSSAVGARRCENHYAEGVHAILATRRGKQAVLAVVFGKDLPEEEVKSWKTLLRASAPLETKGAGA